MAAAGAFAVVGVDRAPLEGGDRVFHEAGFVERVGVDGDLDVVVVGDREAARMAAGVVPQSSWILRPAAPAWICSTSGPLPGELPLPSSPKLIGQALDGPEHHLDVPGAGGDGRAVGAVGRADAAAEKRGDAVAESARLDLLRAR